MRAFRLRLAMPVVAAAALALSAPGCGDGVPGAGTILLTIRHGNEVTPAQRMSVATLSMAVAGVEQYRKEAPVGDLLTDGVATLRYHPRATSGVLDFTITVHDAGGAEVATGTTSVSIDPQREVVGDVVLRAKGMTVDAGADLTPPPDLAMADLATVDLAMRDIASVDVAMTRPDLVMADLPVINDGPAPDLALPDWGMMMDQSIPDMAIAPDLAVPDMAIAPDLVIVDMTPPPDLVPPPDLSMKPDLAGPVMISHTPDKFINNAGDLLAAVATIDTTTRVLRDKNGQNIALPANATFTYEMPTRSAVLHIGGWTVAKGNDIQVIGINQLIVLAAGPVTISARISASAVKNAPGAGGSAGGLGTGFGSKGVINGNEMAGGGGAGFLGPGAPGGDTNKQSGGIPGKAYGGQLMDWEGGSGGGNGAAAGSCELGGSGGAAGAGGGSIQITSAASITVDATGTIDVNGGGGQAGCLWKSGGQPTTEGGGGGGSGGIIFLEAPLVTVAGNLFANGGGGGGAGDVMGGKAGADGQDGQLSTTPAMGGSSSGNGGFGGPGGTDMPPGASPSNRVGLLGGGGGGGAAGRIILHVRAPAMVNGTVSPMPASFVNL